MARKTNRIMWPVAGVLVCTALLYVFWPRPVAVDLAPVTRGDLLVTVDEDGKTRVRDRYIVSAPVAGRLRRILLRAGDSIEAGRTIVAVVEPADPAPLDARERAQAEARLHAAEAALNKSNPELQRARTAHDYATADLARMRQAFETRGASRQALDDAEQRERVSAQAIIAAQFARQVAQFEVEQARSVLTQRGASATSPAEWLLEVPAPVDGKILRVFQESSAVVAAGTRLVEVGDPRNLEVEVDVLSADAAAIPPGAAATLEGWGGPAPLAGRVRLVEPSAFTKVSALGVEEQRVYVIIDLIDPLEKRATLGDGFRVDARIVTWEGRGVLKIPAGALFRHGPGWAVFSVSDGKAHLRAVTVGHQTAAEAELLTGLDEHAQTIVFPSDKIMEGVRITPRPADTTP